MGHPIGWHQSSDGSSRYWDGQNWLYWDGAQWVIWGGGQQGHWVPQRQQAAPYARTRRSNVAAGATVLLGALGIGAAAFLPWLKITGPTLGVDLAGVVSFATTPTIVTDSGDETRLALLACAVLVGMCAVALMSVRVRIAGPILRLLSLMMAALPAYGAYWLWNIVSSPNPLATMIQTSGGDPSTEDQALALMDKVASSLGLYSVNAEVGLVTLTAGLALAFVGCLIPSAHR